ncbi:MAG: PaaI family thioesterase [Hyphomicrobiaceae bacterium]|nr:PaaI family thioesterase [Hyphomicrobiaceae bacterium]
MSEDRPPPDGFAPHFRKSRVTDAWEPLFSRRTGEAVQIGLYVGEMHCNSRGFLHGGVIAALADNAMGLSCVAALAEPPRGLVTVGLTVDYVGAAKIGQWLQIEPRVLRAGKSLAFADALVTADGGVIARASASFKV